MDLKISFRLTLFTENGVIDKRCEFDIDDSLEKDLWSAWTLFTKVDNDTTVQVRHT